MSDTKAHELRNLRHGEYCVLIEFCTNCKTHNSSLRHDEQKYYERAVALKSEIQNEFPFMKVYLKPLDTTLKGAKERLGLFEVSLGGFGSPNWLLVASKLKTLKWPEIRTAVNNIRAQLRVKTLTVDFAMPAEGSFNPRTDVLGGMKAYLVSALDFPNFVQNMSALSNKPRGGKSAKPDFKKERTLSSVVRRKLASGETKPEEIDELLQAKEFAYKLQVRDGVAELHNVAPGNFVLFVAEDANLKAQVQELSVSAAVREADRRQSETLTLVPQDTGSLALHVGYGAQNPIIALDFRRKAAKHGDSANSSQMSLDGELTQTELGNRNGQPVASHIARQLQPDTYELSVEYADYSNTTLELRICAGHNEYVLSYPDMRIVTEGGFEDKSARPRTVTPMGDMPVIHENVRGEERLDGTLTHRARDSEVYEPKSETKIAADEPNKENVNANAGRQGQPVKPVRSEVSASNTSFESRSSKKVESAEQPVVSKNRITSGNRIRPGERLTSAKSNNMAPTVQNELARDREYVTLYTSSIVNDIVWDSLDYEPDLFNIFMKTNKALELRLDFVLEDDELGGLISEGKSSSFSHITLAHSSKVKLVRLYVEKTKEKIEEKVDVYVNNRGRTYKIELSEFLKANSRADEKYCDLCILAAGPSSYEEFVSLVPLRNKVQNLTGLVELKNIVSFVQNSKFDVFKFFGFDEAGSSDAKDQVIGFREAEENLGNYEIYCNDSYVLNAVRYGDKELISARRLEKVYPGWVQLATAMGGLLEHMEEANEEDEPFEPDEFEESDFDS